MAFANGIQMRLHKAAHVVRIQHGLGILVCGQLKIDAPDVVRLAVHEDGAALGPGWIKPGAALGWVVAVQLDIDNRIAPLVTHARQFQSQLLAHQALSAITGHQPLRLQRVFTQGVGHRGLHTFGALFKVRKAAGPAQINQAWRAGVDAANFIEQKLLNVVLLQVDHRRIFVFG